MHCNYYYIHKYVVAVHVNVCRGYVNLYTLWLHSYVQPQHYTLWLYIWTYLEPQRINTAVVFTNVCTATTYKYVPYLYVVAVHTVFIRCYIFIRCGCTYIFIRCGCTYIFIRCGSTYIFIRCGCTYTYVVAIWGGVLWHSVVAPYLYVVCTTNVCTATMQRINIVHTTYKYVQRMYVQPQRINTLWLYIWMFAAVM